jgi:uncharacterized protein YbjT (DUF2867 family)
MAESRSALLVGATGLVGSFLLQRLLASDRYARATVWTRREIGRTHPKLKSEIVDFDRLHERRVEAEDVFCCLGTTIKTAGSEAAFRRVDYDFPVALAIAAAGGGARRLLVVSALGANPDSRIFYNRVKGEMEIAVRAAGVPTTIFLRPSLLAGPRAEVRRGERIGEAIGALLGPLLGKYRPIHADLVAAAMLRAALEDHPSGIIESGQIRILGSGPN